MKLKKQFVVFPILLGFIGILVPILSWLQSKLSLWPLLSARTLNFRWAINEPVRGILDFGAPYGFAIGVVVGLCLATWSWLTNKRDGSSITRLLPNLFWCGCYALLINFANGCLVALVSSQIASGFNPPIWALLLPFVSAFLINLTALFWGAIRSVATGDVLTPRVLRDKLRERMRLN